MVPDPRRSKSTFVNVPVTPAVKVCAVQHDTSIAMLEKSYSAYILDHSDAVARRGLLDTAQPAAGTVISLPVRSL